MLTHHDRRVPAAKTLPFLPLPAEVRTTVRIDQAQACMTLRVEIKTSKTETPKQETGLHDEHDVPIQMRKSQFLSVVLLVAKNDLQLPAVATVWLFFRYSSTHNHFQNGTHGTDMCRRHTERTEATEENPCLSKEHMVGLANGSLSKGCARLHISYLCRRAK